MTVGPRYYIVRSLNKAERTLLPGLLTTEVFPTSLLHFAALQLSYPADTTLR